MSEDVLKAREGKEKNNLISKEDKEFLNPYNFVDVSGPTPRYSFKTNEMFQPDLNSGYIDVEMETVTPLFIPDPKDSELKEIEGADGEKFKHKEMRFFKMNGKPAIPSTSLKGMLRSTVETLSNSCFPHDYKRSEVLNFMSQRLDVERDSRKIRNLKPGILKKYNQKWYFVELEMVKVLTVVDRHKGNNADRKPYEKTVYFARNLKREIEKISIKASTGGIGGYIERKKRNRAFEEDPIEIKSLERGDFRIKEVNSEKIDRSINSINRFNKTFPYLDLRKDYVLRKAFYGIVRKKSEKRRGRLYNLYKLKEISLDLNDLKKQLQEYKNRKLNQDWPGVEYEICQLYLKTSFDIETKTQDRLFFRFGVENLDEYICNELKKGKNGRASELEEVHIRRLESVLAQRYENINKRHEKDYLIRLQPTSKDVKDGMLVYFNKEENSYLTYTQVARRPYRHSIAEILEKMGKSICTNKEKLCPACNMFGGVNIGKTSIGGKVSIGFGEFLAHNGFEEDVTLKPLGDPKPSFYQFYVLDNRKNENDAGKNNSYDFLDIRLGRKVYLKHKIDELKYKNKDDEKTKLNSTVQLLNPGAVFKFMVSYFNLSHYELGILLNSLNIEHNGERLDYQLGMGKPLGLGRIKINGVEITKIDRQKRYSSLTDDGKSKMSDDEVEKYINIFQRYQVDVNRGIPFDKIKLNNIKIDEYEIKAVPDFGTLSYIKDFKLLKSINDGISQPYPIKYPMKLDRNERDDKKKRKGFKWFMEEKKFTYQRLFDPSMLGKIHDEKTKKEIPLFNWGQESEK